MQQAITIKLGAHQLSLQSPQVMAIVNVNPASFCKVGRLHSGNELINHVEQSLKAGAAIIDLGAEPTNPALKLGIFSEQEELDYLIPAIEAITKRFDVPISVDTSRAQVIRQASIAGAHLINDVRALRMAGALEMVAKLQMPVCLMHMRYLQGFDPSQSLVKDGQGPISISEVKRFLTARVDDCLKAGILKSNIIIDPGFGGGSFGKTLQDNLHLLKQLFEFQSLGLPILVGLSRKTFIGELLNIPVPERLPASLAAAMLAAMNGAHILRVHDVKATVEALKLWQAVRDCETIT